MKLSYVPIEKDGKSDHLFAQLIEKAVARQLRVCGSLQITQPLAERKFCRIDLEILPGRERIQISQDLGAGSTSCRLDRDAMEQAVQLTQNELHAGADLLIVNRYGMYESEGGGFRDLIVEAFEKEVPVLIGLKARYRASFLEFAGDYAQEVQPDPAALQNWLTENTSPATAQPLDHREIIE
jgi:hypothetical protein